MQRSNNTEYMPVRQDIPHAALHRTTAGLPAGSMQGVGTMQTHTVSRSWRTEAGTQVDASVSVRLRRTICIDGRATEVECYEMGSVRARVEGHGDHVGYRPLATPRTQGEHVFVSQLGMLGLSARSDAIVREMIAEMESHPACVAHHAAIARRRAAVDEMAARGARNGLCPRCGTYCCGDCQAA